MHDRINKIIWSIVILMLLVFIIIVIFNKYNEQKEYTKKYYYMDTYIYVKIYSNNKNKANKALKEIDNIYKEYHQLTDRYNNYDNIKNIYYIKNNKSKDNYLKIDKKLYDLIKYGLEYKEKTNGLVDIQMGNVIDIWKEHRDILGGIPSKEELKIAKANQVDIKLKDNNKILNNHPNIDLGAVAKGYTTKIVGEYLEKHGIKAYLINAGGNVLVGDSISKYYTIGIEDPDKKDDIFDIVKGKNISVVTSGGYERFYKYNGKTYSHIISPKTLYPTDYVKSVTVITKDSAYADILSTYLYLLPIEDGIDYVNSKDNVEAIWYTNDNEIMYSKGAKKYEYKNK